MIEKHACSASCPCQKGRDLAIAEKVASRVIKRALDVGRSVFTEHLKMHHYHGSLVITDMTNAGKRGKKVKELTVIPTSQNDEQSQKVIKQAVSSILHMNYDSAKAYLEDILKHLAQKNQAEGVRAAPLFNLHEREMRGIDVEPRGTTINLKKEFPDGSIVTIESSPHNFMVKHSALINAPGKAAHGFRQDTLYWPRGKESGIIFYGWLKDNLSKAANMTIQQLRDVWDHIGVKWDSH